LLLNPWDIGFGTSKIPYRLDASVCIARKQWQMPLPPTLNRSGCRGYTKGLGPKTTRSLAYMIFRTSRPPRFGGFCLTTTGRIRKMKNTIKNITLAACCVATCAMSNVALATVGCMTVPSSSSSNAPASYSIEWSRGDEYSGIAVCTDENQGTNVDRLDIRLTQDHLAACYCKLLRPVTSKWHLVSVAGSGGASSCVTNCAGDCRGTSPTNYQF